VEGQENHLYKLSSDVKMLQSKEVQLKEQLEEKDSKILKLTNELAYALN
jgi:hypothetical protein